MGLAVHDHCFSHLWYPYRQSKKSWLCTSVAWTRATWPLPRFSHDIPQLLLVFRCPGTGICHVHEIPSLLHNALSLRDFICSVIADNYHKVFWCPGTNVWHEYGMARFHLQYNCSHPCVWILRKKRADLWTWTILHWYPIESYISPSPSAISPCYICLLPFSQCLFTYGLLTFQKISWGVGCWFCRVDGFREDLPIIIPMTQSPRYKIYRSSLLIPPC